MSSNFSIYHGSKEFDINLKKVPHFSMFPEMMPWVGSDYSNQGTRILIIGESHYFKDTKLHHEPHTWYSRSFTESLDARHGHRVRYQITRSIENKFRSKTHAMHKNLKKVLIECDYFKNYDTTINAPYNSIAFLNYFQRPANTYGNSISPKAKDIEVSLETIKGVINIIKPDIVLIASVKAYDIAIKSGLFLEINIHHDYSAHPCSIHWNVACKKYGKIQGERYGEITGRERFIRVVNKMTSISTRS